MKEKLDIYECILSEQIQQFYRKNIVLTLEEKETLIITSFTPVQRQLEMLRLLTGEAQGQEREQIQEMIRLYEKMIGMIYHPTGRILYICDWKEPVTNYGETEISNTFHTVSTDSDYFDSMEEILAYFQEGMGNLLADVTMIEIPEDGGKHKELGGFYAAWKEKPMIYHIWFQDKEMMQKDISEETISRYIFASSSMRMPLPFESGNRIRLKTPFMEKAIFGKLSSELDGNGCWYHFLYKDDEEDEYNCKFLDFSYLKMCWKFHLSVLDWIELAEDVWCTKGFNARLMICRNQLMEEKLKLEKESNKLQV